MAETEGETRIASLLEQMIVQLDRIGREQKTTREPLVQGEYALVLRGKSESGIATQNISTNFGSLILEPTAEGSGWIEM